MIKKFTLTAVTLLTMLSLSNAQETSSTPNTSSWKDKKFFQNWAVSGNFGSMLFYGDVRQYDFYPLGANAKNAVSERKIGYGITLNKTISPTFSIQGQILAGSLSGSRREINSYFEATTFSYNINSVINLNNLLFRNAKPRKTFFYGVAGLGLVDFRSARRVLGTNSPSENDKLTQDFGYKNDDGKTKDKATTEVVIPVGLGFKYMINKNMDVYVESTLRNVNSDKLDAKPKVGTAKDKYGYTCVGFTYHLNNSKDAQPLEWENPLLAEDLSKKEESSKVDSALYKKLDSLKNKINELDKNLAEQSKKAEELDSDGDGVSDNNDLEPDTKAGALVNFQGKTIALNAQATPTGNMASFSGNQPIISVFFAFGSAALENDALERITIAARLLKADPSIKLNLEGFADKVGSKEVNDRLSESRANAVKNELVKSFGIDANRISVVGKGNTDPLSTVNKVNRRVDFILAK